VTAVFRSRSKGKGKMYQEVVPAYPGLLRHTRGLLWHIRGLLSQSRGLRSPWRSIMCRSK
jgi:hypothetical protein